MIERAATLPPAMTLARSFDVATSWLASGLRLGAGLRAAHVGPRPQALLELYEFEACPYCRKVREALTVLDLPAMIHPCPKRGPTYRPHVQVVGGKRQFPYLVDPNTGWSGYESRDIVAYLFAQYGDGPVPAALRYNPAVPLGSLASAVRGLSGLRYVPSRKPARALELYAFEASPYCRIAREALCELELRYVLVNVGKRSPSRRAFRERSGKMMVPWLADPNTGREMFESADIVRYLYETYAEAPG